MGQTPWATVQIGRVLIDARQGILHSTLTHRDIVGDLMFWTLTCMRPCYCCAKIYGHSPEDSKPQTLQSLSQSSVEPHLWLAARYP